MSFPTLLQQVVYTEKYSRWVPNLGRRETWPETVTRSVDFLFELSKGGLPGTIYGQLEHEIRELRVMPSMRELAMAGPAARRQNAAIFNCAYLTLSDLQAFVEVMLLSMHGTGVGYSVEQKYLDRLPRIHTRGGQLHRHTIDDSTEGWCSALSMGLNLWFTGHDVVFDYSQVRPAGAPLKTKGGRASGPEPLRVALDAIRRIIFSRSGTRLRSIDAHDIACHIAAASISGGVRRSALICLFDEDDALMLRCKEGAFWKQNPQRSYANNSAVLVNSQPSQLFLLSDLNMTGEPGIINREGLIAKRPYRRRPADFGVNPCGEIALRDMQFCNLASVVCRDGDSFETLVDKVYYATVIGTIQAAAEHFPGLRPEWVRNQKEERLLGVDLNGQMDSPMVRDPEVLEKLKQVARKTNEEVAQMLRIAPAAAITTVKPSGNSSQMLNASSGLHARWSPYYIRHVRLNTHSPVRKLLADSGVPMNPENGQVAETANTWVVPFPVKSPEGAIFRKDHSALDQLNYWLMVRNHWTEHQPSVTISYREDEVPAIAAWLDEHVEDIAGLSFLRSDDHIYEQAPCQEITAEEYAERAEVFSRLTVDFSLLPLYEAEDLTTQAQELACVSGVCELP